MSRVAHATFSATRGRGNDCDSLCKAAQSHLMASSVELRPPRALALVVEWATLHQVELLENWLRLHSDEPPTKIEPLE